MKRFGFISALVIVAVVAFGLGLQTSQAPALDRAQVAQIDTHHLTVSAGKLADTTVAEAF
jgi:hypothetical protein